jgi:hypothetical protein
MLIIFVVVVVWAMLVAWIGKLAQSRGRFIAGWAIGAAATGLLAFTAGLELVRSLVDSDASTGLMLLSVMAPPALLIGSMLAIGLVLHRAPISVADRDEWPVHFVNRGPGTISIEGGTVRFTWSEGSRASPLDGLRRVEADGESVRIRLDDDSELLALPMGKPATPAGRRQQSLSLSRRLSARPARQAP